MRAIVLAIATAFGLLTGGAASAQQPPAQTQVPAQTTAQGQQQTRAHAEQQVARCQQLRERMTATNGQADQPTPQEQQELAEAGCAPTQAQVQQIQKDSRDIQEMYDRLMRDSAEDLKQLQRQP